MPHGSSAAALTRPADIRPLGRLKVRLPRTAAFGRGVAVAADDRLFRPRVFLPWLRYWGCPAWCFGCRQDPLVAGGAGRAAGMKLILHVQRPRLHCLVAGGAEGVASQ